MQKPCHIVVFRFSSLGDIAMTVPVLKQVLEQHAHVQILMVSTPFVQPLFKGIERLKFYGADLKGKHKGIAGLYVLYRELQSIYKFDGIADLHNVLRTNLLKTFFYFSGILIAAIDKGRAEKKELTRRNHKKLRPLTTTFERYAAVFASLKLPVQLHKEKGIIKAPCADVAFEKAAQNILIGIAPFAAYAEKIYPVKKMKEVIRLLLQHTTVEIFLFGGIEDAPLLEQWEKEFSGVRSMAGKGSFESELHLISRLGLMISMDSANMHLASLYGVPVVSIWGGTHPWLGFYGWGQAPENAVQVLLDCRPSSVFGNKKCPRGDHACMNLISPVTVYETVMRQLNENEKRI